MMAGDNFAYTEICERARDCYLRGLQIYQCLRLSNVSERATYLSLGFALFTC